MIRTFFTIVALAVATGAGAQTNLALGGISVDPTAPVEITADALTVDQNAGTAVFIGAVNVGQGDLRLVAESVEVVYTEATGEIARLVASGGVTFVTANEAAEAQSAVYDLVAGILTLQGDVLLTQGDSALSAQEMVVDLNAGTTQVAGRVTTVFQPGGGSP